MTGTTEGEVGERERIRGLEKKRIRGWGRSRMLSFQWVLGGWECVGMGCGNVEYSYGYDLASYFPRSTLSSKKE